MDVNTSASSKTRIMFQNHAAWLTGNKVHPLQVKPAPYTSPLEGQIVIRNYSTAVNIVDGRLQDLGTSMMYKWIGYPCILGSDVAGEVVEVGPQVTRFKVGDRVVGHAVGKDEKRNNSAEGAFQLYVVLLDHMSSPIPDHMSYENACVLPLGTSTAACGLFVPEQLGLQLPSVNSKPKGETVLIWGGSTSVGSSAIQLAVRAGYEVFTTSSPHNFNYVRKLGAAKVFNYKSKTVVDDMVTALKGKQVAGAISMAHEGTKRCMDILARCDGKRFVSLAAYPVPDKLSAHFPILQTMLLYITGNLVYWFKSKTMGVDYNLIFATSLVENGVGKAIYGDYLPQALEDGKLLASPEPVVVGNGLESIQAALNYHKTKVSAKKVVVSLKD
ncbi:oxidoreductase [Penicillium pulvis]|uniref:oxidoreductase n=1 Tax=Penicillium pulvis TaxID=1562058 RepID=UPI002546D18A|nr:oxidoreductase [Penicillium pulvis]KAJ5802169.1 oxidoreductase [Penicillium pulvis]